MTDTIQIVQTSNNVKQNYRDYLRKYFRSNYSSGLQYIKDIVLMLMNFKDINNLQQVLGEKEYKVTLQALQEYDSLYNYSNLIADTIVRLQEKTSGSELMKTKIDQQNRKLFEIAVSLPATNFRVLRAFFILVNNCDLRNISVPKDEKFDSRRQYPSYLSSEKAPSEF